ncbi:MAG: hypothetical protein JNK47_12710 [Mesorhizobium sp.]|nr:hypothetical protein [Mesorhizobium sp.]MBL8578081.1 hypothetical protein [Mesorhizobium sp.]
MANIPLQIATRQLDVGGVVQYPSGSPVGQAMQEFGATVANVADRFRAKQQQREQFDAQIIESEFTSDLAKSENDAVINAPADGSGIHDSVYGQIDPVSQTAVKPGSFDRLFDGYAKRMPASQRNEFLAKREAYRKKGSLRLAQDQYKGEQAYYGVELQKLQTNITNSMAALDPNDVDTFDEFKQQGVKAIRSSGLPALERDVAEANWLANADETLFKLKLEKDPSFAGKARAALGLASEGAAVDVANIGSGREGAKALLRKKEGFRPTPYWDVNAHRIGYGSDTITREDGSVARVQPGMTVSRADAERDLDRRVAEFEDTAVRQVGRREWGALPPAAQAALTSVTYNYGDLPNSVVNAVKTGNIETIAASVEGLQGHNNGVNASRRKAEAAMIRGQGGMEGVGAVSGPDPQYANISLDRRLVLANQADVQLGQVQRAGEAQANADYAAYKDSVELQVVRGEIADEGLILNDPRLKDGDKASLTRSWRTQSESTIQLSSDLAALGNNTLVLDPYSSKDKTRADNLYTETMKRVGPDQATAVSGAIFEQTGVVPQPVINTIRRGLASQNPQDVVAAAQTAQRVSQMDPAALGRRDGGSEVQKAADDFGFYVNRLNLPPEEAAQRLIDSANPDKRFDRKTLEPASKEFLKAIDQEDLASNFDDWGWSDPQFASDQELAIKGEYLAIAEDEFFAANGNAELAKDRAIKKMKNLYGVSDLAGSRVIMKHPPEKYWPQSKASGEGGPMGVGADPFRYARTQLAADVATVDPNYMPGSIRLLTTPETDREIKAGKMPGYAIMWTDKEGRLQTMPGQHWRPDPTKMLELEKVSEDERNRRAIDAAYKADALYPDDDERNRAMDEFLAGPATPNNPNPTWTPPEPEKPGRDWEDGERDIGNPMGDQY